MTNYQRLTAKVFGETATATGNEPEIGQFGSALAGTYVGTTDVATIQNLTAWSNGFIDCVTPENQFPPLPEMTGFGKVLSYHEAYLLQKGIPEWDSATTYYQDDFCRVGHTVYYSLQDGNINHNPTTDAMYWKDFTIGANQELSNLEDAGEDRLHALKGYLESGKGYTDTTLYKDVYGYNHSTFDVSKFTVSGTPTITDDGIASVTADGNMTQMVSIPFTFDLTAKKWSIISNFTTGSTVGAGYTIGSWRTNDSINCYHVGSYVFSFSLYVNIDGTRTQVASGNASLSNLVQFRANTKYVQIVSRDNDTYTYTIYNASNPSETGTITITSEYDLYNANVLCVYSNSSSSSLKSCNLKEVKVVVNDYPTFSGNKTGIDTIKPANYTVVGTPTISADGIASGFTTSDYISIDTSNIDLLTANTWEIDFTVKLNNSTATTQMYFDTFETGVSSTLRFDYNNPNNQNAFRMLLVATDNTRIFDYATIKQNIVLNTWYKFKLSYTGTHYIIKDADGNILKDVESNKKVNLTSRILVGKRQANDQSLTNGSIDLNAFKIYVDGNLIYQPCLKIPYTESSTGSKVVDVVYRDRVIDVYQQYGSALYYTIDETNQNATLPMGEVYGFIEQKANKDFSNVTQTAKNTSISWGMPDWSRMVSKTPYTEYTATERGWINASVSTDQNEFGLKINGYIVARALATGSSDAGTFACLVPVDVGDVYTLYHEGTRPSLNEFINFIPCKGDI